MAVRQGNMKTRKPKPFIHHLPVEPGGGRALCDKRANAPARDTGPRQYGQTCRKCLKMDEKRRRNQWDAEKPDDQKE